MKSGSIAVPRGTFPLMSAGDEMPEAVRATEVPSAMGEHGQAIETLGNLLCRLQDRLVPVLAAAPKSMEAEPGAVGSRSFHAPLAAQIAGDTGLLRDCIQSVEDLLQRLEV